MNDPIMQLTPKDLRYHLYLTQGLLLGIAVGASIWLSGVEETVSLLKIPDSHSLVLTLALVFLIVAVNIMMEYTLPAKWQDDGEISRKLFSGLSVFSTFMLCGFVGLSEEMLFRGVIQPFLGNAWTSILFTAVHFRYLFKPLLLISVFAISWLLGWLFVASHGLFAPVLAHTLIDFFLALYLRWFDQKDRRG